MPCQFCQLCVTGFPIEDGYHYGTQALGMIPSTRCKATPVSKTTDPERSWFSKADKAAYDRMPDCEWFHPHNLDHMIRNPTWRCKRLKGLKALESRVVGPDIYNLSTEYRKLPL